MRNGLPPKAQGDSELASLCALARALIVHIVGRSFLNGKRGIQDSLTHFFFNSNISVAFATLQNV